MKQRRILVVMGLELFSRRAMLEGFHAYALERGWSVVREDAVQEGMVKAWDPAAIMICPKAVETVPRSFRGKPLLSVFADRTAMGIASIVEDDEAIGVMAAGHLVQTGLRDFAAFAYNPFPFSRARISAFRRTVVQSGGVYHKSGEFNLPPMHGRLSDHLVVSRWLASLKKPCGIFACCDPWARSLTSHCDRLGIRLPEDVALIGAENDHIQCELVSPPISSISLPWYAMGWQAAALIEKAIDGKPVPGVIKVKPTAVAVRRSSEITAVEDADVSQAVRWIRDHAHEPVGVNDVLRAVPVYRRKLERRFRAVLGRTMLEEIRRVRVENAKRLLAGTSLAMPEIAGRTGYASATRLAVAFGRETGMTPGAYRRSLRSGEGAAIVANG